MSVPLRHSSRDHFDDNRHCWVSEADQALDRSEVEDAAEALRREEMSAAATVISARLEHCDWVYTLQRWQEAEARTLGA